ncbi:MAG: penicillin-binding protein 2, partial [Eggerthellaceae bacterium]|nr:penicillin-binding protein 2 [Eggerthellaceae bacterium]
SHSRTSDRMRVKSVTSVGISAETPKTSISSGSGAAFGGTSVSGEGLRNRFIAVGVLAAGVFGALAVRLFGLQVLNSASYSEEAQNNLYTTVNTPAPRGVIYDSQGVALVSNRQVQTVLADADVVDNPDVILRLSSLLGIPYEVVRSRILDSSSGAQSQRVVASDVKLRDIAYISEHRDAFPGVTTQVRTTRSYPYGALAAHVLGYTGTASEDDLKNAAEGRDIESGDAVGKSGVEQTYDALIAGDHGQRILVTDATGVIQQVVAETDPSKGNDVYLTIDARVQYVADTALKEAVTGGTGTAAACVVIDVETGGIVAMSNYPTYEPERFIGGISQDTWDAYQTEESHYPLMNRSIAGTYPAASCFKAFTGLAGLTYGFADTTRTWDCTGTWTGFGDEFPQDCWLETGHGPITFREGVIESCDTVFYEIAKDFYDARGTIGNEAMQDFIKEFGYAASTHIDLSGEAEGRIPTPQWKQEYFKDVPEEAQWLPGDMSNMVIGQGYVLVTPIQVARAYAAVATGRLLRPHLLKEVRNSLGETVLTFETVEDYHPEVDSSLLEVMQDALHGVATENASVSADFGKYSWSAAAKTGTAEVAGKQDMAWFSCYAPYEQPKFALALCLEEGGSGGTTGSPIAARIMDAAIRCSEGTFDQKIAPISATEVAGAEDTTDSEDDSSSSDDSEE